MSRPQMDISEEDVARFRDLRAAGMSWINLSLTCGFHIDTIRRRLDPTYADRVKSKYKGPRSLIRVSEARVTSADAKRALAGILPDTRTLHARFMGDPPPGRSALDQRRFRQQGNGGLLSVRAEPGYYLRGFLG